MAQLPTVSQALKRLDDLTDDYDRPTSIVQHAIRCEMRGETPSDDDFLAISRRKREIQDAEDDLLSAYLRAEDGQESTASSKKSSRSPRSCKNLRPYYINDNGHFVFCTPRQTYWYLLYVKDPHCVTNVPKYIEKFRRRFRMPHDEYLKLLGECRNSGYFDRWTRKDATGTPSSPLSLLVLGALRCLGRGLTFDDLEEHTAIGEETHRQFFHVFIRYGEEVMYPYYIRTPTTSNDFDFHRPEFDVGGLTGAGFSTDGTHVVLWNCQANLRQAHLGFKLSNPARAYNMTTNHRREIIHSTKGHPGRWNDKSLAHHDAFMRPLQQGQILQDVVFDLMEWVGPVAASPIRQRRYRGGWGIVDNGYHRWACTQAPSKINVLLSEQRFSDWIESFRKDSECVFGILKGRWRVLKTGIRLHGVEAADRIWMTCCALHNRLLIVDGHSQPWDGSLGENDVNDMRAHAPLALQRLSDDQLRAFGSREHENSSRQTNNHPINEEGEDVPLEDPANSPRYHEDGSLYVNSLSYDVFRGKLIEHYDILFRQHKIRWPTRTSNDN